MSDDLFDHVELVSMDTVMGERHCNYCNAIVTYDVSGEISNPDCTMECGDGAYMENTGAPIPEELDFNE
jgi:hypothetical protein